MTREQLLGAIARGWCHPKNANKEMDGDLALAIADEIEALSPPLSAERIREIARTYFTDHVSRDHIMNSEICEQAITAALQESQGASGWQLVPIEPTEEMITAAAGTPKMLFVNNYISLAQLRAGKTFDELSGPLSDCAVAQAYKAMIAAAPKAGE